MKESWISRMSLNQKAEVLCGKNFWDSHAVPGFDIPSVSFCDGPHGLRKQKGNVDNLGISKSLPATCFPTSSSLACTWDKEVLRKVGEALGKEAAWFDVDVLLGPGMNLMRHPFGGRNFEYFSEDPYLTGILSSQYCLGVQQWRECCPKHFLLNSQEKRRMWIDERASDTLIHDLYALPFEMVIDQANPAWMMMSYNKVNGIYASQNLYLYHLLRNEFLFKGAVVSDWGGSPHLTQSIQAGLNLEMPSTFSQGKKELVKAVQDGVLSEDVLDQRIRECIPVWNRVIENRKKQLNSPPFQENEQIAIQAAAKSMVLLEEEGILPISTTQRLVLIGNFNGSFSYQGEGSSRVNPTYPPNIEEVLKENKVDEYIIMPFLKERHSRFEYEKWKERVHQIVKKGDLVLFLLSLNPTQNIEGADRTSGRFPEEQLEILNELDRKKSNLIVIDGASGAMELPEIESKHALIYMGLAGQGSLYALFDLLLGKREFEGRLAFTIPYIIKGMTDNFQQFPSILNQSIYSEGAHIGYRSKHTSNVRFPFGYGKSQGKVKILNAKLSEKSEGIEFILKNTSEKPVTEVAQLYIRRCTSQYGQAQKELKGFVREFLLPYEVKTCFIPFDQYTFRLYNAQNHQFEQYKEGSFIELGFNASHVQASIRMPGKSSLPVAPSFHDSQEEIISQRLDEMPLELCTTNSFLFNKIVRLLQKSRDKGLKKGKPNLVALALLDMPLHSLPKSSGNIVSKGMIEQLAKYLEKPTLTQLKYFVMSAFEHASHVQAHKRRTK